VKKIFIHSGLHKTGTTGLQAMLFKNRKNLSVQGFYYPDSGIPRNFYGHHNIAWQISRDRRFRSEFGDLRGLLKEIEGIGKRKIVLSSEDFECSLLYPNRLKKINDYFLSNDIKVCFIIYLRNQVDYLNSLYFELLKAGFGDEFNKFCNQIISTNKFAFKEWEFVFNYSDIPKSLESLGDIEVIYRDYDDLIDNNTVVDFCDVVGIDYKKLEMPQHRIRINERPRLNTLLKLFVKNRVEVLPDGILDNIDELCKNENYDLLTPMNTRKIFTELSKNSFFYNKEKKISCEEDSNILNVVRVFSFETCSLILNLKKLNENPNIKKQFIEKWHHWVKLSSN
jgi:hypothetical protein